jgi:hypothetical protein
VEETCTMELIRVLFHRPRVIVPYLVKLCSVPPACRYITQKGGFSADLRYVPFQSS